LVYIAVDMEKPCISCVIYSGMPRDMTR
jgi:hypothetical protein